MSTSGWTLSGGRRKSLILPTQFTPKAMLRISRPRWVCISSATAAKGPSKGGLCNYFGSCVLSALKRCVVQRSTQVGLFARLWLHVCDGCFHPFCCCAECGSPSVCVCVSVNLSRSWDKGLTTHSYANIFCRGQRVSFHGLCQRSSVTWDRSTYLQWSTWALRVQLLTTTCWRASQQEYLE